MCGTRAIFCSSASCQSWIEVFKSRPASSIMLTTGTLTERPIPNLSVVASYAAGLHGMTRNLALDLKPTRVNLVSLGMVDTDL
jgi:NAD(P)-dependent dehydrogenase (short-subunit alcohol dehydrogenase family)